MNKLRQRLGREDGFTLSELLVVVAIVAVLVAIAVPTYLGFTDSAKDTAGAANARDAQIQSAGAAALNAP